MKKNIKRLMIIALIAAAVAALALGANVVAAKYRTQIEEEPHGLGLPAFYFNISGESQMSAPLAVSGTSAVMYVANFEDAMRVTASIVTIEYTVTVAGGTVSELVGGAWVSAGSVIRAQMSGGERATVQYLICPTLDGTGAQSVEVVVEATAPYAKTMSSYLSFIYGNQTPEYEAYLHGDGITTELVLDMRGYEGTVTIAWAAGLMPLADAWGVFSPVHFTSGGSVSTSKLEAGRIYTFRFDGADAQGITVSPGQPV